MTTIAATTTSVDGETAPVMGRATVGSLAAMSVVASVASMAAIGKGDVCWKGPAVHLQGSGYDGRLEAIIFREDVLKGDLHLHQIILTVNRTL